MTADSVAALAPLAALAAGGIAAMLAAAFAPRTAAPLAAAAHVLAALLVLLRLDSAQASTTLLADDGLARAGTLLASVMGLAILGLPRASRESPALVTLASAGAAAAAAATHAASLLLALETVTLATVALAAARRDREGVEAAIKLLVPAGATAAAMFLGFALLVSASGHFGLSSAGAADATAQLGAALLLFALLFKFALVPAHMWAPDLFEGGTAQASAVAGILSKAAAALVLLRILQLLPEGHWWREALAGLGALSFLLGGLVATRQATLVRLLGWSSVAQSGLLAMLVGLGRTEGTGLALLFALWAYGGGLLAVLAAAEDHGADWPAASAMGQASAAIGLLSLAGLPAAGGFVAKLLVARELVAASAWVAVAILILGSALSFVAYFRFVGRVLPRMADGAPAAAGPLLPPLRLAASGLTVAASGFVLLIGIAPGPLAALLVRLAPFP